MNKMIYVGVYVFSLVLALFAGGLFVAYEFSLYRNFRSFEGLIYAVSVLGGLQFVIVYIVYTFILLAKMWGSIQDSEARTTPGKAIGFLFIPIFSVYWIFNVWGGFPTDYNNFVERYRLQVPQLSSGLFIAFPLLVLLSGLSFGITLVINFFVILAIIPKVCDAVNAVKTATLGQQPAVQYPQAYAPAIYSR